MIKDLKTNDMLNNKVFLCKKKDSALTKAGKSYYDITLADRSGELNAKIWDIDVPGINPFCAGDFVEVSGSVTQFGGQLQAKVTRIKVADAEAFNMEDFLPASKEDPEAMWAELLMLIGTVNKPYYDILVRIFTYRPDFEAAFKKRPAAKGIHHAFLGGLLQHTLAVAHLCDDFCGRYPVLNRDLLITAALCHDIGKVYEQNAIPGGDYTDEGLFLGHIVMGSQMVAEAAATIPDFPKDKLLQLQHCILAHHGRQEWGSPQKPALAEAYALHFADNLDARMEGATELLNDSAQIPNDAGWYQKVPGFDGPFKPTV